MYKIHIWTLIHITYKLWVMIYGVYGVYGVMCTAVYLLILHGVWYIMIANEVLN